MAKAGTIEYKGIFFLVNSPLLSFAASTNNSKSFCLVSFNIKSFIGLDAFSSACSKVISSFEYGFNATSFISVYTGCIMKIVKKIANPTKI